MRDSANLSRAATLMRRCAESEATLGIDGRLPISEEGNIDFGRNGRGTGDAAAAGIANEKNSIGGVEIVLLLDAKTDEAVGLITEGAL